VTYAIGIAACCCAEHTEIAVVIQRDGHSTTRRWRSAHLDAHNAVAEAVARVQALRFSSPAPRTIYVRQQSVATMLRDPLVRWSSARSPDGEHPVLRAAVDTLFR